MDARCAIELKAPGYDKGRAIAAFLAARRRSAAGRRSLSATTRPTKAASPSSPRAAAAPIRSAGCARARSALFASPRAVRDWLAEFADRARGRMTGRLQTKSQNLDLALIGNCCTAALVDRSARIVWWCFPHFDSDPVFSRLLAGRRGEGLLRRRARRPRRDRVALRAQHRDRRDDPDRRPRRAKCASCDFAPRFERFEREYRPPQIIRRIEPLAGLPRITIRVRPTHNYGRPTSNIVVGSNHIRYIGGDAGPASDDRRAAVLYRQRDHLSADPSGEPRSSARTIRSSSAIDATSREFLDRTREHWLDWVAQSRGAVRVAVGGDARGDHPQAVQLHGDRRDRRRAHDVDSRSADSRRATGTTATAGCATPISSSTR